MVLFYRFFTVFAVLAALKFLTSFTTLQAPQKKDPKPQSTLTFSNCHNHQTSLDFAAYVNFHACSGKSIHSPDCPNFNSCGFLADLAANGFAGRQSSYDFIFTPKETDAAFYLHHAFW